MGFRDRMHYTPEQALRLMAGKPAELWVIGSMEAWLDFVASNPELIAELGGADNAYLQAANGGFVVGGGAAPLIEVIVSDDPPEGGCTYSDTAGPCVLPGSHLCCRFDKS